MVQLLFQPWVIFLQDGAPPHSFSNTRHFLFKTFPKRWIGQSGPRAWLPSSPDITSMDIFFREYVKDIVPDINSLKVRIQHTILTITGEILANIWTEIDYCLDIL